MIFKRMGLDPVLSDSVQVAAGRWPRPVAAIIVRLFAELGSKEKAPVMGLGLSRVSPQCERARDGAASQ